MYKMCRYMVWQKNLGMVGIFLSFHLFSSIITASTENAAKPSLLNPDTLDISPDLVIRQCEVALARMLWTANDPVPRIVSEGTFC